MKLSSKQPDILPSMAKTPPLKLKNAPIVEAVFDLDCDLPHGFDLRSVEAAARDKFRDTYPEYRPQFMQELLFDPAKGSPTTTISMATQALQFRTKDNTQIVQVRTGGFSFNRLAPYGSLDDYLAEIERTWKAYVDLVSPVQIRVIRLRYINRILIPLTENAHVDIDDYFTIGPSVPDEKGLMLTGFISQQSLVEEKTGREISILLTTQPSEQNQRPMILDITVAEKINADPDWQKIRPSLNALRTLKNRMFRNSLTDKCIQLFQ